MEIVFPSSLHLINQEGGVRRLASTSSSSSRGRTRRYILDTFNLSKRKRDHVELSFYPEGNEKDIFCLSLKASGGRRYQSRGWEALRFTRGSRFGSGSGCAERYRAYRLGRPPSASSSSGDTILIFERADTANFLSLLPDETPLGEICLPGTHESCALYGFPISQCQQPSTPIEQQLLDGVRFLDVRLRVVGDELLMYHGPRPQRSSLPLLLSTLHSFLSSHPSEFLILCLKEESPPFHPQFSSLVYRAFAPFLDRWFLEERIPTLGEVRGKGLLLTRFDKNLPTGAGRDGLVERREWERDRNEQPEWEGGVGIHPTTWPDSRKEGFEWDCYGTTVRTQDWYRVKTFLSIPEKFQVITTHLHPSLRDPPKPTFTLSYTSASYFPLSLPTIIAKGFGWPAWGIGVEGINARLCYWLLCLLAEAAEAAEGEEGGLDDGGHDGDSDGDGGQKARQRQRQRQWQRQPRLKACVLSDFYRQCAGEAGLAELLVQMNFV